MHAIIHELKELCFFKTEVVTESDMIGYYNKTQKEWFGIIKIMHDKKADIAINLVIFETNLDEVVDFLIPLFRNERQIYIKMQKKTNIKWAAYFQVKIVLNFNTILLPVLGKSSVC